MNLSYYSAIKKGTVEVTGSTTTVNETTFKTSDLNAVISVKVTNQGQEIIAEQSDFLPLKDMKDIVKADSDFNEIYGDSYISGFLSGGEFTGIISVKVIDRKQVDKTVSKIKSVLASQKESSEVLFSAIDASAQSSLFSAMSESETTISVAWMGGGQVKPGMCWREYLICVKAYGLFREYILGFAICPGRCCRISCSSCRMSSKDLGHSYEVQGKSKLHGVGKADHFSNT